MYWAGVAGGADDGMATISDGSDCAQVVLPCFALYFEGGAWPALHEMLGV